METGIPQGSLISPQIYPLYADDITDYIKRQHFTFADDTVLAVTQRPKLAGRIIGKEFKNLQKWAHGNNITINEDKTTYIHMRPKRATEKLTEGMKI